MEIPCCIKRLGHGTSFVLERDLQNPFRILGVLRKGACKMIMEAPTNIPQHPRNRSSLQQHSRRHPFHRLQRHQRHRPQLRSRTPQPLRPPRLSARRLPHHPLRPHHQLRAPRRGRKARVGSGLGVRGRAAQHRESGYECAEGARGADDQGVEEEGGVEGEGRDSGGAGHFRLHF